MVITSCFVWQPSIIPKIKSEHVVSFDDAIFVFAITLVTLSIDIPDLPPILQKSQLLSRPYDMYALFYYFTGGCIDFKMDP
jgi:uncharacterized membrane protein